MDSFESQEEKLEQIKTEISSRITDRELSVENADVVLKEDGTLVFSGDIDNEETREAIQEILADIKNYFGLEEVVEVTETKREKWLNAQFLEDKLEQGQNLEKIAEIHNLDQETAELMSEFAQLRRKLIDQSNEEVKKRKENEPQMTDLEEELGIYRERLEPHVREAVESLVEKDYDTSLSGFGNKYFNQFISFEEEYEQIDNLQPEQIENKIKEEFGFDINVDIEPDRITFECNELRDEEELKQIWNEIESFVPRLN